MSQKVLVLCQKKTGKSADRGDVKPIIDKINNFVKKLLGENTDIKYLTDMKESNGEGTADFIGTFGNNAWTVQHLSKQSYKLIICNTCPYMYMDYYTINAYLLNDGLLALTAFNRHSDGNVVNIIKTSTSVNNIIMSNINRFFELDDNHIEDALIFKKLQKGSVVYEPPAVEETYTITVINTDGGANWTAKFADTNATKGGRVKTRKNKHILMPNKRIFKNRIRTR